MSAALLARAVAAQVATELRLTLRRGESLLITILAPCLLLVLFASLNIVPAASGPEIDVLLPGMLALAVIATGMVSLGISTAYERYYGVLKLLGGSPLPRAGLIVAKALAVLVLEAVQVALLVGVAAAAYGWRPQGAIGLAVLALLLGTATFTGLGLAMAGGLRAEMTLALANGLYFVFLLLGGVVLPLSHLPAPLQLLARLLPAAPLTAALRAALTAGGGSFWSSAGELALWAVVAIVAATFGFRWE